MAATEEYENQLPIQNTGKHIRALDANGNPILIPIDEMAKVVGGLIGTATAEKDGLMSSSLFIENMVVKLSQPNGGNTSLYKIAYRNAFIISDVFVLTDVGSYVSYRIVYSGNLSFSPSVERMGYRGYTAISNLKFYKDSSNNVYMLVTTGSYGIYIFNTNCVNAYNLKPILEKQPSTDVSNFTEITV